MVMLIARRISSQFVVCPLAGTWLMNGLTAGNFLKCDHGKIEGISLSFRFPCTKCMLHILVDLVIFDSLAFIIHSCNRGSLCGSL